MANQFPEFQRSVSVQPGPVPAVGGAADELTRTLSNFASFAGKQVLAGVEQADIPKAQKAGTTPGFKTSFGISPRARNFNKVALAANKAQIETEISARTKTMANEVLAPGNFGDHSLSEFNAKFQGFSEGLLQNVPDENRELAKNLLTHYSSAAQSTISGKVQKLGAMQGQAFLKGYLNNLNQDSNKSAFLGDTTAAASKNGLINQTLEGSAQVGLIDNGLASQISKDNSKNLVMSSIQGDHSRSLSDKTSDKFMEDFNKSKHDLPPADVAILKSRLATATVQFENKQVSVQNTIDEEYQHGLAQIRQGTADQSTIALMTARAKQFMSPEKFDQINGQIQEARIINATSNHLQFASDDKKQQIIADIASGQEVKSLGLNPLSVMAKLQKIAKTQSDTFKRDQAAYTSNDPIVQEAFKKYAMFGEGDPYQVQINRQIALGSKPSDTRLLSKSKSSEIISEVNNLTNSTDKLKVVNDLVGFDPNDPSDSQLKFGTHTQKIINDLNKDGLGETYTLYNMQNNPDSKSYIPQYMAALNTGLKTLQSTYDKDTRNSMVEDVTSDIAPYLKTITGANGLTANTILNIQNQVLTLAYQIGLNPQETTSSASQKSADAILNNFFNIDKVNGNSFRYPKDMTIISPTGLFQAVLNQNLDSTIPPAFRTLHSDVSEQSLRKAYNNNILNGGGLQTNPQNTGFILIDQNRDPVIKNKQMIQIPFSEVDNLQSELSNNLLTSESMSLTQGKIQSTKAAGGLVHKLPLFTDFGGL